jgi:phosphomannomutase
MWGAFALPPFSAVESQRDPDASFPTVAFPNPEEKGALDEAIRVAQAQDATLIVATDPDADRCVGGHARAHAASLRGRSLDRLTD